MDDAVDAFLEEPLVVAPPKSPGKKTQASCKGSSRPTAGRGDGDMKGSMEGDEWGGSSSVLHVMQNESAAAKWAFERDRCSEKKNEIKALHERHHGELVG